MNKLIRLITLTLMIFVLHVFVPQFAFADGDHTPIGDAVNELPIFDAHMHYSRSAWSAGAHSVEDVIGYMDDSGVAMALVSSNPDEGTILLWEVAPDRIVPELQPYQGDNAYLNWTKDTTTDLTTEDYLEGRLEQYPHEGIGEFHILSEQMWNEELFLNIIKMAKERDIYLHVHSGDKAIRWIYGLDPDVKIIWAHAGLDVSAEKVYALMSEFPELLADTSLRERSILPYGGDLDPTWEMIILEFHDRLMVGSDTWNNGLWADYERIIASNRTWLSHFPREVAENIAYKNAERYFNRKISMELIGTE